MKELKPLRHEGPKEVVDLLDQYKDIVTKEFPSELAPIRDICHNIDLILAATLPKKEAYKLTPEKN